MKALKTIGKVILVLVGCVLMPVLIWVALGAAIHYKLKARKTRTITTPTLGEILQNMSARGLVRR